MNVFMAAVYTNAARQGMRIYEQMNDHEQRLADNVHHILESYHYVHKDTFVNAMRKDNAKVFLDSGAFSAFTLGVKIDLDQYCNYIKCNSDIIRVEDGALMAAVLDGIGDPYETYCNQLAMEERGVKPMPCFHQGEDERYLKWYIENYDYISLGGMVGTSVKQLMVWLDRVWDRHLIDGSGNPKIKVHGFGITSVALMERYPWYSCDSSSWLQIARFGAIMDPQHGPINISSESPSRHVKGEHLMTLSEPETEYMLERLESQGFTYERLSTVYQSRFAYNLWAFGVVNEMINASTQKANTGYIQELF